jgi:preprotein translocase subunit SecF
MTSLTTLFAILPLIFMGGDTIRAFTAPLIIGVLGGTVSSICIAPNLYYEICKLTKKNKYKGA